MRGILVGLLVAMVAWAALTGTALGVIPTGEPPPQPYAPSNEARVAVDPDSGVGLSILWRRSDRVFVQAWRAGGTPVEVAAYKTQDLGVVAAQLPASSFSADAPNSLYSGDRGWVYWRPFVYCYDPNDTSNYACYGETRSFLYVLPGAKAGGVPCGLAKRRQRKARKHLNAVRRRFAHARTPSQRRRLRRKLRRATREMRQARQETRRAC